MLALIRESFALKKISVVPMVPHKTLKRGYKIFEGYAHRELHFNKRSIKKEYTIYII